MIVYRLSRAKYKDKLSGYGASLNGQRWNSKGTEVIYTADSRALASFEVAVHISLSVLPKDYFMLEIEVPASLKIWELPKEELPIGWDSIPSQKSSKVIGDRLVEENEYAVLKVPSAVVKGDFNYIINPRHKKFGCIKIISASSFPFDERLFDRSAK